MITLTNNAINQIRKLVLSRKSKPLGIKLDIETKGCSGLTYKLEYELKNLPKQIEDKEIEINTLTEKLSDGDFYKSDPDGFFEVTKELKLAKDQLEEYEERWLELEELSQ